MELIVFILLIMCLCKGDKKKKRRRRGSSSWNPTYSEYDHHNRCNGHLPWD